MRMHVWAVVAVLGGLSGCGSRYGKRVPDDLVSKLPYENKVDLLEAENDLFVAYDKVDEMDSEVRRTRDQIRRAKSAESAAGDEVGQSRDSVSREVAQLAVEEARSRVSYLRARQEVNLKSREVSEVERDCAVSRYQLARLTAVRKVKVGGSEGYKPDEFERQVKACETEVADRKKSGKADDDRYTVARTEWEKRKEALARRTFDARASPFVEKL